MQKGDQGKVLDDQERLFLSLVEQLSRPLLQISRISELACADNGIAAEQWQLVQSIASSSLQLTESYALSLRVQGNITPLAIEPVTVSSLLYDTVAALKPYATEYAVELQLDTGPKMEPVLADRAVLHSALVALGQVFVASQAESDQPVPVRLSAHRSRYGIVAGLYGQMPGFGADSLRRVEQFRGRAQQPLSRLVSGPAAGVFVADSLLKTLAARLHVAKYQRLNGLATTLQPSRQLQLI